MAQKLPIVLLPGIMGSRLYLENGYFWDPDSESRMLWYGVRPSQNRERLHARVRGGILLEKPNSAMTDDQVRRGWSGVVWDYYGKCLQQFEGMPASGGAYAIGYDWRQNIAWIGRYVADKIRKVLELTGAERVLVVTHSMGGLVLRAALKQDATLKEAIRSIVYVCQPAVGAVVLYRRMLTGLVRGFDGEGSIPDRAFRWLLGGGDRPTFVANVSGLPGALQLLPSEHYRPASAWNRYLSSVSFETLYTNAESPPGIRASQLGVAPAVVADVNARLGEVARFHALLGPPDALHPDAWTIYGDGELTESGVAFPSDPNADRTPSGDGVVPVASAAVLPASPERRIGVAGVAHDKACAHSGVLAQLNAILGNYLNPPNPPANFGGALLPEATGSPRSVEYTFPVTVRVTIGNPVVKPE